MNLSSLCPPCVLCALRVNPVSPDTRLPDPALAPLMHRHLIETRGLTRRFGARVAVDGLNLRVTAAGVYGFLGPNGAGKTTAIRMLLGLIRPAGEVRLFGAPLDSARQTLMRRDGALARDRRRGRRGAARLPRIRPAGC